MREKSEKRAADVRMSSEVHKLLEEHFYVPKTVDYEEVNDRQRQIKGVDVIFDYDGFSYFCDEKAAVRWRNLKTYTLELAFVDKNGNIREGWLTDDNLDTNSYMFVWVEDDGVEYALIKKSAILSHLESLGWTKARLRTKAEKIRNNFDEPLGDIRTNGCCFKYSRNGYVEKPINVQMAKEAYLSIADYHGTIKTEQFKDRKDEL